MSLANVIKDLNKLRVGRQQRLIESSRLLTVGDSIDICRHIEKQLDPDILTCDGKLSNDKINEKLHCLENALVQLKEKGFRISSFLNNWLEQRTNISSNNKNADSINKVKSLIDNWDSNKLGFAGKRRLELCLKELQKVN